MEVILLEKVNKLGELGEKVKVKSGYGRNYLIPQGKALAATVANQARFEKERAAYLQRQQEIRASAEELAARVSAVQVILARPAGSSEKLFGSVTNADIADFFKAKGVELPRKVIEVPNPIRTLGEHPIRIKLHPDVTLNQQIRVERSTN